MESGPGPDARGVSADFAGGIDRAGAGARHAGDAGHSRRTVVNLHVLNLTAKTRRSFCLVSNCLNCEIECVAVRFPVHGGAGGAWRGPAIGDVLVGELRLRSFAGPQQEGVLLEGALLARVAVNEAQLDQLAGEPRLLQSLALGAVARRLSLVR